MKKLTLRLATLSFTFVVGVAAATSSFLYHHRDAPASASTHTTSPAAIDPRWVYVTRDITWIDVPEDPKHHLQYSVNGDLVIFYPPGQFASVIVGLERDTETNQMWMLVDQGFSVFKGSWVRNADGTMTATSCFSHGDNYGSNLGLSGRSNAPLLPARVQKWLIRKPALDGAGLLESHREAYVPLPSRFEGLEELAVMVAER